MENTLNIQITLNDEQLRNLIVGNISDLPKEKLQDVLIQAIREVLTSTEGRKLFLDTGSYSYSNVTPSTFLKNLVDKADIAEAISPVVNQAVTEFAANYPAILEKCLKASITEMFMSEFNRLQLQTAWDKVINTDKA